MRLYLSVLACVIKYPNLKPRTYEGNFWVILHGFIGENPIKTSQMVTLFPHYGKLPYLLFKLPYSMFSDKCTAYSLSKKCPNNLSKTGNILLFLE